MSALSFPWRPRLAALASAVLLAACGTAPLQDPSATAELPTVFAQGQDLPPGQTPHADWWVALGDPVLDELVQRGLGANLELQQAAQRVARSRALAAGSHAALRPSGGVGVAAQAQQASEVEAPGFNRDQRRSDSVSAGLDLSWEIDLFGRLRHQAAAASARAQGSAADADAMRLLVTGEIAHAWFALTGAREQWGVTQAVIENRRATLALVERRAAAGLSAPIDAERARAELAAAQADVPVHEAAAAVASHRLAVLLGESPSAFEAPRARAMAPSQVCLTVPAPAMWLPQRPDLRAAERLLAAQTLDVAAVRAEFMPRVSVSGVLGFVGGAVSGLGAAGSTSWFVAPSVSLPVFDRGRIQARLDAARAHQREALLAYQQRVLLATEEVENALARVRQGQLRLASLQQRAGHAGVAEGLARKRYDAGASGLLELLDAQRSAQQADLGLAAALMAQRQDIVALYRALGARYVPVAVTDPAKRQI